MAKHNLYKEPLYHNFHHIKSRCYNKNDIGYKNYGGKGVTICDEWLNDFKVFYSWAIENGWKKGMQIDKDIKCNELNISPKIYSPETCSIVTSKINNNNRKNNRKIKYKDEKLTVAEWSEKLNIPRSTINNRLIRGWSISETFEFKKRTKIKK